MASATDSYDVVLIGNGVLALSTAYQLKKRDRGLRVAVIGPRARPGSATLAAGAKVNVWAEFANGQFDNPALADRAELGIRAMPLWDDLCAELGQYTADPPKVTWGTYVINNALGSPHEVRTVDYILKIVKERGIEHRVLSASDVPWLQPEAKAQISRVVWLPDGRFHPAKVLAAYEKALVALDAMLIDGSAVSFTTSTRWGSVFGGSDKVVRLADGSEVRGNQIVLANGSYAQALIDQVPELKREVPRLIWGAGSALEVSLPDWVKKYGGIDRSVIDIDHVVRTVDRGGACGLHLVPHGNGEYYCGASSGVWFDPEPKARVHAIHVLLRQLVDEIHKAFFFAMISIRGPGFRPTAIDGFPLLGHSHIAGIWFANGTKRDGLTCSPYLAGELASAILGGPSTLTERFRPSRKLISYKNKPRAIADAADADIGGEFQHGLFLPPYAHEPYRQAKITKVTRAYELRKISNFGIHPEMVHLYENDEFFKAIDHPREQVAD